MTTVAAPAVVWIWQLERETPQQITTLITNFFSSQNFIHLWKMLKSKNKKTRNFMKTVILWNDCEQLLLVTVDNFQKYHRPIKKTNHWNITNNYNKITINYGTHNLFQSIVSYRNQSLVLLGKANVWYLYKTQHWTEIC